MATSTCPKCSGITFEMKEAERIKGNAYRMMFIQCASCGAVVGTADFFNAPKLLEKIAAKLTTKEGS